MTSNQEHARHLYINGNCSQRDIAKRFGVSERTVYNWVKGNAWDRLRHAAATAPITIAENLSTQLVALQNEISNREPGNRFPTRHEADVICRMVNAIDKTKKAPALPLQVQVMRTFRQYALPHLSPELAKELRVLTTCFLEGQARNGYLPHQPEYALETLPTASAFFEDNAVDVEIPEATGNNQQSEEQSIIHDVSNAAPRPTTPVQPANAAPHSSVPAPQKSAQINSLAMLAANPKTGNFFYPETKPSIPLPLPDNQDINTPPTAQTNQKKPETFLAKNNPSRLSVFRGEHDDLEV
jgi:transcriptional regulator with XRE-family HTH domain